MPIVILDDSELIREQIKGFLESDGYSAIVTLGRADELLHYLENATGEDNQPDLILVDWVLPDMSGLDAVKLLKSKAQWRDLPFVMVTSKSDAADLEAALDSGASDFLVKPVEKVTLLARVRAALRLKYEMDRRRDRERELMEVTRRLEEVIQSLAKLSTMDALTGISNRRLFDEALDKEWRRCLRENQPMSVVMVDIDHFKEYNDHYGHVQGDEALKYVAEALTASVRRPGDMIARYGGEEFAAILPGTPSAGASFVAEVMRHNLIKLGVEHSKSPVAPHLTVSCGVASMVPKKELRPSFLVAAADEALYEAKRKGRNQSEINSLGE